MSRLSIGLGSRIKVKAEGLEQLAEAMTASSIFLANDSRVHFGLGRAAEADLEVRWLSGAIQSFKGIPANRIVRVDEDK